MLLSMQSKGDWFAYVDRLDNDRYRALLRNRKTGAIINSKEFKTEEEAKEQVHLFLEQIMNQEKRCKR